MKTLRVFILTQNERLYLPASLAHVCSELRDQVACVVTAPPTSTHGGFLKALIRHLACFGVPGLVTLGWRNLTASVRDKLTRPGPDGPFYSVRAVAEAFGVPYAHVERLRSQRFDEIMHAHPADVLVSMSCPQFIGRKIRDRFPVMCLNVHGAPLPKYRGLMPAFWVLRNGERRTAVTVHELTAKLDDGRIVVQREVEISPDDTWDSLVRKTKAEGARALVEAIRLIEDGRVQLRPNPEEEATYFSFPTRRDRLAFVSQGRRFF